MVDLDNSYALGQGKESANTGSHAVVCC